METVARPQQPDLAVQGQEYSLGGSLSLVIGGIAAIVLAILALLGFAPRTLELVAMLAIGSSFLLSGGSLTGRTKFA